MAYGFDHESHAPILVLWWSGSTSREDLTACLDELTALFEGWDSPGRLVFDTSKLGDFDPDMRRLLASWRARNRALIENRVAAAAYVFTSRLTRGYLTAVDWLKPTPAFPRRVFSTRVEAVSWLESQAPKPSA
ncbi:MAG: hypothetical protein KUG77_03655 [Nannocystaceae bacterium]|nr:hypothetical protein [Nannocystaceae bacterium]